MFTGIVNGACPIAHIERKPGLHSLVVTMGKLADGLEIGASVALDGVCMTVTSVTDGNAHFDAMQETLTLTSLGTKTQGDLVNVERSATQGAEIGGHLVSGHIDAMAQVVGIEESTNNRVVSYRLPPELCKYVMHKGFIAVNGCSLTVASCDAATHTFSVWFIPETLRATTHGATDIGNWVNIEIDRQTQAIVDTVERVLASRS